MSGSLITAIMEITNTIRMLCVLIPHVLDYDEHVLHCLLIVVVDTRKLPHPISLTSYVGFVPCTFYCNEFIFYVSLVFYNKTILSFTTIPINSKKNMYMFLPYQDYLIYKFVHVYITVNCTVLGSRIVELTEQGYRDNCSILA